MFLSPIRFMNKRPALWLVTSLRKLAVVSMAMLLSACSTVRFQPTEIISHIRTNEGYRLQTALNHAQKKEDIVIMMFSGGGTRAAALGYGVLEALNNQPVRLNGKYGSWLDNIDVVYGVSGGSVLATYFSLHGKDTIPAFESHFLKRNFQRQLISQFLSLANLPRLTSSEFGRGDLLQEQFENALFGHTTFGDLAQHRKGPFAVISATDMMAGRRLDFTQEYFDVLCLNLSDLKLARAVAASSAVPLIFAPVTLNNNGGNCGYALPDPMRQALDGHAQHTLQQHTQQEYLNHIQHYASSRQPYLHLLDGGLTDNLGLRHLLEMNEIYASNTLKSRFVGPTTKRIIVITVNAQNQLSSDIGQKAAVPGLRDTVNAVISIPIDQQSQGALRRFRTLMDAINASTYNANGEKIKAYFISLNLYDLPESALRHKLLNIPTTFNLPHEDIRLLKSAAPILLERSAEYQRLLQDLEEKANPAVDSTIPVSGSYKPAYAATGQSLS